MNTVNEANNESTRDAIAFEQNCEHEIRFYLKHIRNAMLNESFTPQCIITAVKLPSGAIEVASNNTHILEKIDYILEAYDGDMHLVSNPNIIMQNLMVV